MSDLVVSVISLCKIIQITTEIAIKPDLFRISKQNKLDVKEAQIMLSVLHRLCCFSPISSCKGAVYTCVSKYMIDEGGNVSFLLSPDASSRQILLCLVWVISHGALENIIDKIIIRSPLGEEVLFKVKDNVEIQNPIKPPGEKAEDLINYASFLAGKVNHNLKAIRNYREERAKFQAKIYSETAGFQNLPHLSVADLQLLVSPGLSADFLASCQPCLEVLETYLKWQRRAPCFWRWMGSILKEEEQFLAEKIQTKENLYKAMSTSEVDHLHKFLKKLEENVRKKATEEVQIPLGFNSLKNVNVRRTFLRCSEELASEILELDSDIKTLTNANERKINELKFKLQHKNIQEKEKICSILNTFQKDLIK